MQFIDEAKVSRNDLNRIFTEDWWPLSFLLAYHYDVDVTYAVIVECLKWRRSFSVDSKTLRTFFEKLKINFTTSQMNLNLISFIIFHLLSNFRTTTLPDNIWLSFTDISLLELKPLLDRGLAYIHGKDCNGSSIRKSVLLMKSKLRSRAYV